VRKLSKSADNLAFREASNFIPSVGYYLPEGNGKVKLFGKNIYT
jgi:hypothetical protein